MPLHNIFHNKVCINRSGCVGRHIFLKLFFASWSSTRQATTSWHQSLNIISSKTEPTWWIKISSLMVSKSSQNVAAVWLVGKRAVKAAQIRKQLDKTKLHLAAHLRVYWPMFFFCTVWLWVQIFSLLLFYVCMCVRVFARECIMMHIMRGLGHIHHLLKAKTKHAQPKEAEGGRAQKKRNEGKR